MARLPDPGGIPRHLTWDRCLPLLNRWSPEDNIRVHHGRPFSQCPTNGHVSRRLLPIGHHNSRIYSRDVQLRITADAHVRLFVHAGYRSRHASGGAVDVSVEISQHQRGYFECFCLF